MPGYNPYRKSRKQRRKQLRRRFRKNRKQLVNRTTVPVGLGFPKKMVMTHKYCETFTLGSTAGALGNYKFSCNGMYDPNITGTGHQPMYFDQMAQIYDHYTVIGSRIIVKIAPETAGQPAYQVAMFINDDTTYNPTDPDYAAEQSTTSRFVLVPPSSTDAFTMSKKWSAKKYFGSAVLANNSLQGTSSANPTEQSYFEIYLRSVGSSTSSVIFQVEIQYIAVWAEIKDLAPS